MPGVCEVVIDPPVQPLAAAFCLGVVLPLDRVAGKSREAVILRCEPLRRASKDAGRCVQPSFGARGACHRARIRATRWLAPQDDGGLCFTPPPHTTKSRSSS